MIIVLNSIQLGVMLTPNMSSQEEKNAGQDAISRIQAAKNSNATSIDLSALNLTTIPASLAELVNLEYLELQDNQITILPDFLAQLSKLKQLDLANNQVADIPDAFSHLADLEELNLNNNRIKAFPDFLTKLTKLESLYFSGNMIAAIPDSLAQFPNLKVLGLSDSHLASLPDSFGQLAKLEMLGLRANEFSSIPSPLAHLHNLEKLFISENRITSIPNFLATLSKLESIELAQNQIAVLPDFLSQLVELRKLDLSHNQIATVPDSLAQLTKLERLDLDDNPLPEEILTALKRGIPSFFRYLTSFKIYPRTVKLVLLGEPKSGKTTLLEALRGNPRPCDDGRQETIGVNVLTIEKPHPMDNQPIYLSAWDFAGQHIEHATHQFFLTENALYLILWNARQGTESGRRDLWYWLELLKMRVRNPKFLLVATHIEHTPPDLNLSEIEHSYPGCQGHFPIELSSLKGLEALQTKILELAVNSPSLRAKWPAEWLSVRDEIRTIRKKQPYMTPGDFRSLMEKNQLTGQDEQKDLVGQLHNLGEILYFQERDELSSLVILNPEWVTELIALVVRSKQVREQNGILRKVDLDTLWKDARLRPEVWDHLIHLMDWFDLTYSTGHSTELGIVLEAVPYSTPESRKEIDLGTAQPQTERIFRFPSLHRRLPPGIPTWGIARAHRFLKFRPWRDAARFEDARTNSQAVILASDANKEIRLRVAADYPPYFIGLLQDILLDTFKRYPGMEPELRIPCPCSPECTFTYLEKTVSERQKKGKSDVSCDQSGEDVAIETLLSGARRPDTKEGLRALRSELRRGFTKQLRLQREMIEKTSPSIFTLTPNRSFKQIDSWLESITQEDELELVLYCEHDSGWHPTEHSVYLFRPDQEWFDRVKNRWNQLVGVTKYVAPLAKTVGKLSGVAWAEIGVAITEKLPEAARSATDKVAHELGRKGEPEFIDTETRHLLEKLISHLDSQREETEPRNGGLYACPIDDGRLLWLCPQHLKVYRARS